MSRLTVNHGDPHNIDGSDLPRSMWFRYVRFKAVPMMYVVP